MVSGAPAMVRPAVSKPAHAASNFFAPLLFLSHPVLTRPTWEAAQFPVDRRVFECSVFTHGESPAVCDALVKSEQSRNWRNSASPWDALLTLEVRSSCSGLNHIGKIIIKQVDGWTPYCEGSRAQAPHVLHILQSRIARFYNFLEPCLWKWNLFMRFHFIKYEIGRQNNNTKTKLHQKLY